mmetsp:Transcript_5361/g.12180  ORF Transcript_5361/g.12180 Transcript_5361/m.12180 type:complete len:221 (-) Transcript_5361:227-889(-)
MLLVWLPRRDFPQVIQMTRTQRFQPARPSNDTMGTILKEGFELFISFVRFSSHGFVHACIGPSVGERRSIATAGECAGVGFEPVGGSASQDCPSGFVLTSAVRIFVILLVTLGNLSLLWSHRHQHFRQRRERLNLLLLLLWIIRLDHPISALQQPLQQQWPSFPLRHAIRSHGRFTTTRLLLNAFPGAAQREQCENGNDGKYENDDAEHDSILLSLGHVE